MITIIETKISRIRGSKVFLRTISLLAGKVSHLVLLILSSFILLYLISFSFMLILLSWHGLLTSYFQLFHSHLDRWLCHIYSALIINVLTPISASPCFEQQEKKRSSTERIMKVLISFTGFQANSVVSFVSQGF